MHLFEGKTGILRPKNGLVFELMPYLAAFYHGQTPINNNFLIRSLTSGFLPDVTTRAAQELVTPKYLATSAPE
jgi:hypothetical protein